MMLSLLIIEQTKIFGLSVGLSMAESCLIISALIVTVVLSCNLLIPATSFIEVYSIFVISLMIDQIRFV